MIVKYEAGFTKPLIPEGEYKAEFVGVKELSKEDSEKVNYDRVVLKFKIVDSPDFIDVVLERVCGARCTAGTALGKLAAGMASIPLDQIKEGLELDLAKFEGKVYRVSVETVIQKNGDKYSSIGKVYGEVNSSSPATPSGVVDVCTDCGKTKEIVVINAYDGTKLCNDCYDNNLKGLNND